MLASLSNQTGRRLMYQIFFVIRKWNTPASAYIFEKFNFFDVLKAMPTAISIWIKINALGI